MSPSIIRSMTGFARVKKTIHGIDAVVSLKSVNHRGLDLHFHMSSDLDPFEAAIRAAVKRNVGRGHVDVRVSLARSGGPVVMDVDSVRLENYLAAFARLAAQHKLRNEPDLNSALRLPGMLQEAGGMELTAAFEAPLVAAVEEALAVLNQFRAREGADLMKVMLERNTAILDAAQRIEQIRSRAVEAFHGRLKERLAELLNGAGLDPQRVAQEAAMLADRSDVGEETARLKIHAVQLAEILTTESDAGKKIDFLLQEMNRETNTILSKTSGIGEGGLGITELALAAKSDIEKIREQALNIE
ncbi:MAG: YicC/YloC family endoribonuclease [Bryobacteraceae bacterium]